MRLWTISVAAIILAAPVGAEPAKSQTNAATAGGQAQTVSAPPPSAAKPAGKDDYTACDGFPAPSSNGDGIISGTALWGLVSQVNDFTRSTTAKPGQWGFDACERVLADDTRLKPKFVLRRANLIQAKAGHLIALQRFDDALAALAEVEQLGTQLDPGYFANGLGIGDHALRAYVYEQTGREPEARAEIDAIRKQRPYSVGIQELADQLAARIDPGLDADLDRIEARGAIDPIGVLMGFFHAIDAGEMERAARLGQGLTLDLPGTRRGWTIQGDETRQYEQIQLKAELTGAHAYALAATGDPVGAAREIAAARSALDDAMEPPPPPEKGKALKKSVQADYDHRVEYGKKGQARIDTWEKLIALRIEGPTLDPELFMKRLMAFPAKDVAVIVDLLTIAPLGDEGEPFRREQLAKLRAVTEKRRLQDVDASLADVIDALPRPEDERNKARFGTSGDGYFLTDSGYSHRQMDGEDDWTVRATDHAASGPTLEEAAVLSAALLARDKGYDRVLVQTRRVVQRRTTYSSYGTSSTSNSGREAQLRVRFVKSTAPLPPELAGTEWRMLAVDKTVAELLPRFKPPTQTP